MGSLFLDQPENLGFGDEANILALLPAFAIGATDGDETAAVQQYLANSPEAMQALAPYSQLAQHLLYAAPTVSAPDRIKQQLILALAQQVRHQPTETPTSGHMGQEPQKVLINHRPIVLDHRRWFAWPWHWPLPKALAAGALLVFLGSNLYWAAQWRLLNLTQQQLSAQLDQQRTAIAVLAMDSAQRIELHSEIGDNKAEGSILWGDGFSVAILYVEHFPQLGPNQTYQMWLTKGAMKMSVGLFAVSQDGAGILFFALPQALNTFDRISITLEPVGGSSTPSTHVMVAGETSTLELPIRKTFQALKT